MKKKTITKKKPAARSIPPPMIRLRLPSEKPTMEDADVNGCIAVVWKNGQYDVRGWDWPFHPNVRAWLGRLPDGILPREPSREKRWRAEFEIFFSKTYDMAKINGEFIRPHTFAAWEGFLAAKKGGAE